MFFNINIKSKKNIYLQIYNHIKEIIENGILFEGSKLPSTRELSALLNVSRNSVIKAYEMLEDDGFIYTKKGKGTFVCKVKVTTNDGWQIKWKDELSFYAKEAEKMDIMKHEQQYKKGMISFKSIAPDEKLFNLEDFKRAFLNRISIEGEKILNYGYAKGYKPFIDFLKVYMEKRGVNLEGKDILITNGFTEGFDMVLTSIFKKGDKILCENPTHNTAIKLMKLHDLKIVGINMNKDGIDTEELKKSLDKNEVKASYLVPSYHNPTGIVMTYKKREEVYHILKQYGVPIIEDGFNEELQYLGSHIAPIAGISGRDNSVIYIGSLSKILFPGMRIGWILADSEFINVLESVKRSRNIHTSVLDQAVLYEYMKEGYFDKYVKKVRSIYREKYELGKSLCEKYISNDFILGDGGLYIFIKLKGISSRELLQKCYKRGVLFTPGDIFYVNNAEKSTLRLGFSRLSLEEIEKGIKIIADELDKY